MSTVTDAQVRAWIERNVEGVEYYKAYEIANDLEASAKSVGWSLRSLADDDGAVSVERWSRDTPIVWQVANDVRQG